mgnify:CR=1 FL=1
MSTETYDLHFPLSLKFDSADIAQSDETIFYTFLGVRTGNWRESRNANDIVLYIFFCNIKFRFPENPVFLDWDIWLDAFLHKNGSNKAMSILKKLLKPPP